ncbi:MAG: Holliday junction DNA helicase RuvA [Planctomycetales bacterium]|nr:Holliday junction DNA helicase RuvA [Planctomycetales bacterium]
MITKITGKLLRVGDETLTLAIEAFEYEVMIPEFTRRQLQGRLGSDVSLHTIQYIDGNAAKGGKLHPRLIGFLNEVEREFFDLICTVDGMGVKKALRAIVRPVAEVAELIQEKDAKGLAALPGVGAASADRIVAKLHRKMPKFALLVTKTGGEVVGASRDVVSQTFDVLRSLGHSESEARKLLDAALEAKKKFSDVESLLQAVYEQSHRQKAL